MLPAIPAAQASSLQQEEEKTADSVVAEQENQENAGRCVTEPDTCGKLLLHDDIGDIIMQEGLSAVSKFLTRKKNSRKVAKKKAKKEAKVNPFCTLRAAKTNAFCTLRTAKTNAFCILRTALEKTKACCTVKPEKTESCSAPKLTLDETESCSVSKLTLGQILVLYQ